jgi:tRNA (guanine37-N1)-methyltransferase
MRIDIITLFPEMFKGPFEESILKRAQDKGLVEINIHNLRKWAKDKHKTVDDRPYGGGTGMIIKPQPVFDAVDDLKGKGQRAKGKIILLTPRGKVFNQEIARKLSKLDHIIFICGHYEGVDERVREHLVDEEVSIGDYILTGGELPAMVVIDTIVRLIPGVLEKQEAIKLESFSKLKIENSKIKNLLEYPQYTRPANFKGWKVPGVLLSGDHKKIAEWRVKKALEITKKKRPDLLKEAV